ncbi:MAG TPA: LuxR C-terminal-related transcriptional regulator, partial [Terriglobales bacterium]|nr:LuxR C-terminal-related transcriptional regulator [Terriglobales bacterium]
NGFTLLRQLRTDHPDVRTIILLDSPQRELVVEAFRAGAKGIFCRIDPIRALRKCIYRIHAGEIWASNREMEYVLQALRDTAPLRVIDVQGQTLLPREQQIVECIAAGLSNRETGDRLRLSEHTIKNYLARIYHKLGVSSRAEVIFYACTYLQQSRPQSEAEIIAGLADAAPDRVRKLAEQGLVVAQYLLAKMYRDGEGVAQDSAAAYTWFLVAEQTCREISRCSRNQRELLQAQLDPKQMESAKATGLQHASKLQQQIQSELGEKEEVSLLAAPSLSSRN